METINDMKKVQGIYHSVLSSLDNVLIGQTDVKKAIATSILCDSNSKILLVGNTGTGKTTLSNYLASSFNSERISVTSDLLPSDVQSQLINRMDMRSLQLDEFNRASGKVLSAFIELFAEKQLSMAGKKYSFNDFYVFATQNNADISGTFNIPQAVYDRFDVNIFFGNLTEEEKRQLFFSGFKPSTKSSISELDLNTTKTAVDSFSTDEKDQDILMKIFDLIDSMTINDKRLFAGSNIRAHKYALKLAKLSALVSNRNYILATDVAEYINYLYMHRIDQNVAKLYDTSVSNKFENVKDEIMQIKRPRF